MVKRDELLQVLRKVMEVGIAKKVFEHMKIEKAESRTVSIHSTFYYNQINDAVSANQLELYQI